MLFTILFLILSFLILSQSETSLHYAFYGFSLWYSKMIPSLLPFMILSGMLIKMNRTESFANILHPILHPILRCSKNITYAIIMGFFCGFPMGAKVTAELLKNGKITMTEAQYLLCFCNNIGPVYFFSFVIPLCRIENPLPYVLGMYGIPFLYGIILRYTVYSNKLSDSNNLIGINNISQNLLEAMDSSIHTSIQSILMLCGYMIIFNLINIIPHFILPSLQRYLAPLLEITGGLSMINNINPLLCMVYLTFGGLSCFAQTHSMISGTSLSMKSYFLHKCFLTLITAVYYILLYYFYL